MWCNKGIPVGFLLLMTRRTISDSPSVSLPYYLRPIVIHPSPPTTNLFTFPTLTVPTPSKHTYCTYCLLVFLLLAEFIITNWYPGSPNSLFKLPLLQHRNSHPNHYLRDKLPLLLIYDLLNHTFLSPSTLDITRLNSTKPAPEIWRAVGQWQRP